MVTKREIIASISILAILLIIGTVISDRISDIDMEQEKQYSQALKIKDKEIFEYAMKTSTGNAFVEGEMNAVNPVTYDDLEDHYILAKKITERYTMHTRIKTYTVNGKTRTKTETYWTWDEIDREVQVSGTVTFLGVEFNFSQFDFPASEYIKTVKVSSKIRHKYYGIPKTFNATIYSRLAEGNIASENVPVYANQTTEEVLDELINNNANQIVFWLCWLILCMGLVYVFVYAENDWLNKD